MAVHQAVVLALALMALVAMPCVIALFICADDLFGRRRKARPRRPRTRTRSAVVRRRSWPPTWPTAWQERWLLLRLDRALEQGPIKRHLSNAAPEPCHIPIEQIVTDLSRLDRQRLNLASHSRVWHVAVQRAYDDRLRLACGCLGLEQHLTELDGTDLEIERVRVEGELHEAGLSFGVSEADRRRGPRQDQR
jgi:hypothetical protein